VAPPTLYVSAEDVVALLTCYETYYMVGCYWLMIGEVVLPIEVFKGYCYYKVYYY
jgi:hypothetical protein